MDIDLHSSNPIERLLDWQRNEARQVEEKFATELMAGTLPR